MSRKHLKKGDANPTVKPDVLRVYSMRYCPFAERALLALAAKGIDFEIVNCNLMEKPEFLLERNPLGKVPVLEYQGNVVPESLIVSNLVDDLFPDNPLRSEEPYQKARDSLAIEKFGSVIPLYYKSARNPGDSEIKLAFDNSLREFLNLLTARKTKFFSGDQCGMVDLMAWPWIERTLLNEKALDFLPELKAWADRMGDVPAVKACRVPKEEMDKFHQGYKDGKVVYDF